jgi:hypothetical protein
MVLFFDRYNVMSGKYLVFEYHKTLFKYVSPPFIHNNYKGNEKIWNHVNFLVLEMYVQNTIILSLYAKECNFGRILRFFLAFLV